MGILSFFVSNYILKFSFNFFLLYSPCEKSQNTQTFNPRGNKLMALFTKEMIDKFNINRDSDIWISMTNDNRFLLQHKFGFTIDLEIVEDNAIVIRSVNSVNGLVNLTNLRRHGLKDYTVYNSDYQYQRFHDKIIPFHISVNSVIDFVDDINKYVVMHLKSTHITSYDAMYVEHQNNAKLCNDIHGLPDYLTYMIDNVPIICKYRKVYDRSTVFGLDNPQFATTKVISHYALLDSTNVEVVYFTQRCAIRQDDIVQTQSSLRIQHNIAPIKTKYSTQFIESRLNVATVIDSQECLEKIIKLFNQHLELFMTF